MKGLKLMIISGLLKTTLLDYPQHVAATIFLGGCNFRCPFCHNSDLLEGTDGLFSKEEVLTFLKKRAGILEGIWNLLSGKSAVSVFWLNWIPTDTGRMY